MPRTVPLARCGVSGGNKKEVDLFDRDLLDFTSCSRNEAYSELPNELFHFFLKVQQLRCNVFLLFFLFGNDLILFFLIFQVRQIVLSIFLQYFSLPSNPPCVLIILVQNKKSTWELKNRYFSDFGAPPPTRLGWDVICQFVRL
jgi:hypothetical protein